MPRTPAVYDRKVKWRRLDASEQEFDRENYPSVELAREALRSQFEEEEKLGMMRRMTEEAAREEYPDGRLRIASLGALEKDDESFRVIHDGTHGAWVNPETRVRDQVKNPGSPDVRAVLQEKAKKRRRRIALKGDARKAHRRCRTRRRD